MIFLRRNEDAPAYSGDGGLEYAVQPDDQMRIVQGRCQRRIKDQHTKLVVRAFPYITGARVETRTTCGQMVQRLERLAHNQHDSGSNPDLPTTGKGHPGFFSEGYKPDRSAAMGLRRKPVRVISASKASYFIGWRERERSWINASPSDQRQACRVCCLQGYKPSLTADQSFRRDAVRNVCRI